MVKGYRFEMVKGYRFEMVKGYRWLNAPLNLE
jgi:hypothetical protein